MAHEEWRDVAGYEGLYQVSNLGRVRSLERFRHAKNGTYRVPQKILKTPKNAYGYPVVSLHRDASSKVVTVHQLVAAAFIDNPDGKRCIDHINAVRDDNRVSNLRWATHRENTNNMFRLGRQVDWEDRHISEDAWRAMTTSQCKPVIRSDGKRYNSIIDAARDLGYKKPQPVSDCVNGRRPTARGYSFRYA